MKHFYFIILTFLTFNLTHGQGLEDFTNSNATNSYSDGSFEGNNSITWSYIASRNGNNDSNASGIELPALMLRRASSGSKITSSAISGGISNFSMKLYKGFTGGGDRQVELFINGVSKGISTPFDDFSEYTFSVDNINVSGNIVIEIVNTTPKQIIIDDISWTGFSTSCLVIFGQAQYSCEGNSIGDSNDFVTVSIPYSGSDDGITSLTTTSGGSIGGDDPATTSDGTIVISGVSEGSGWDLVLNGGDCDGISTSGTTEVDFCDPIPNTCYDLSNGNESFELVAVATNSDSDVWVNNSGTYNMNGYCGSGCTENSDTWLLFGPLDTTQTNDLKLAFNATEQYGVTDLIVAYTEQYGGCPALSQWITATTVSDPGEVEVDLSQINGTNVYIGIQYYDDGTGGFSGWTLTDVTLNSFGNCPILGNITPSDCATCDVSLDTAVYSCGSNIVGDNNDEVIITVPYIGSESSLTSITTSSNGNLGGDDPALTADGNIILSGLIEGDLWDITLNGGDCDGTTISGTIPASLCDPVIEGLVINEILADPGNTNSDGNVDGIDANNDGTISTSQDEFFELYNNSGETLDISGYTMEDFFAIRHTFPAGTTMQPNEFLVVFSGGTLDDFSGNAQIASSGALGLNNSSDFVTIKNPSGAIVVSENYTGATDQSICRDPDFTGDFVGHLSHSSNPVASSPGQRNDGVLSVDGAVATAFELFPNPSNTGFINIKSNQNGAVKVKVFDMLGKQMIDTTVVNERLEVSSLNAGIYIVNLTQNDRTTTKKLILQ
ncbi:MAG: lamin tail domain-containing protein [Flavobacteriaceae bacterium]